MEIGSLAELISAFGTLAALGAASVAAYAALKTNSQQSKQLEHLEADEDQRREELEREQASKFAAWPQLNNEGTASIHVRNASHGPVYAVTFHTVCKWNMSVTRYSVCGPDSASRKLTWASRHLVERFEGIDWLGSVDDDELRVGVTFRDAAGNWWLRDFAGQLHRQQDEASACAGMLNSLRDFMPNHPTLNPGH